MLIELHCTCGHRQALSPEKLPPKVRCAACKNALKFCGSVRNLSDVKWLTVGGQTGAPRLAIPIPVGVAVKLGRSPSGWLSLPGEEIEDAQTELQIAEDARVLVKHLVGDGGTWINRARIVEGVLGEKDRLRIGPYVMGLLKHDAIIASVQASLEDDVVVEVEVEDSGPKEKSGKGKRREPEDDDDLDRKARRAAADDDEDREELIDYQSGWSTGQKIRMVVSVALILGVSGYLAKGYFFPPISEEMPSETVFYCPADGTQVKSEWSASAGAPKCPVCGQRCVGELKYKSEVTPAAARAAQAATSQAAPAEKPAAEVAASQPTTKPVKKKSSNKKKSSKKKKMPRKKPESGGSS